MIVVLDTNFLIDLARYKIDLKQIEGTVGIRCELATLDKVVDELKKIAQSRKKDSKYAKLALILIDLHKIKILSAPERSTDKALTFLARSTIIATNDRKLRKNLRAKKFKTIYLRAKKHLAIS
jgi:rRNA-processing protein FCF1